MVAQVLVMDPVPEVGDSSDGFANRVTKQCVNAHSSLNLKKSQARKWMNEPKNYVPILNNLE